jgi:hypothetical protein
MQKIFVFLRHKSVFFKKKKQPWFNIEPRLRQFGYETM